MNNQPVRLRPLLAPLRHADGLKESALGGRPEVASRPSKRPLMTAARTLALLEEKRGVLS
jgi:hypothetical protein